MNMGPLDGICSVYQDDIIVQNTVSMAQEWIDSTASIRRRALMIFKRLFNGLLKQILSFAKMTDEALWLEIQQGNEKSYRAVFYKYYKLLVSIALRYVGDIDLAKDLAQDVFLKMWEKRG